MPPKPASKAPDAKPKDPKVEAEEQAALVKAIKSLTKEREKQSENVLLKRLKAKDRKVIRTKKVVKFSAEELPAASAAAIKIQAWTRMLAVWLPARRLRTSVVESIKGRAQRPLPEAGAHDGAIDANYVGKGAGPESTASPGGSAEDSTPGELRANAVLRQLPAHQSAIKLSKNVKTAKFQQAALRLQASVRTRRAYDVLSKAHSASAALQPRLRAIAPRSEWKSRLAEITISKFFFRSLIQPALQQQRAAISLLQARCRRCVREVISDQKRKTHQATFKRAYVNHKMWLMREIWTRRDAIIEIQSQIRRAIANDDYMERILLAREANRARRTRRECGVLLTSRCRMALDHWDLHRHVNKYNLLRRKVRAGIEQSRYHELAQAAATLQTRLRSVAWQLKESLSLRLPLKRHTQYYPNAVRMAAVLQAACRRWCMESMGQPSFVELHPCTGKARIKLCLDQTRDAAVELQMHVRRLLANNVDDALVPKGYARILTATELLHAQIRRVRVRTLIHDLMRMYGIMSLQAIMRRNTAYAAYGSQLIAQGRLAYACRRSLVTRWYVRSAWAQTKLQAYAKMTTTPQPDLKFSQMPTRELAKCLQARMRGALARYELVLEWDATLTLQTLVRCRLRRMLYLQSKAWSKKATSGTQHDVHKFFGSLNSTSTKGTHMWRTRRYVERTKERGPLWKTADFAATADAAQSSGDIKAVAAVRYVTTEARRRDVQTMQELEAIEGRVHTEAERRRNGCLFNFQIASGSRRILNQGRIVHALSCTQIILDPLTSSEIEDEYRHFFLENNGIQRRIIKYTPEHIVTVVPPFEIRPVVNTMYYVVDLEPTPIEPNLVKIRRERQRRAATALQYACRYYTAKKLYRERKFAAQDAQRKKDAYEAIQRAYEAELEAARQKMLSEEQARREAMAEGRRLLQELEAAQQAKMREKQEADDARHERLLGLTPRVPVAPVRLQEGETVSPSPRRRQVRSISTASYSQLMGTPLPDDAARDGVADELRRRIAIENSQLELAMQSMHEEREGAYSRESSRSDADSESAPLHSTLAVRRHVRRVNHGLHVDRSPPKLNSSTSAALEELNDMVSAGELSKDEANKRRKKVLKSWRTSPQTSPRERLSNSQEFDLSPRR